MLQFYTNKMHRQSNESKMSLKCPPIFLEDKMGRLGGQ